jgi:hypothetical protein
MTIVQDTAQRLVVRAGTRLNQTTLTLDKQEGRARFERNLLMWRLKPVELALSDIADVEVRAEIDAASGAETHVPIMRTRDGLVLALPVREVEADDTVRRVCGFLGLSPH